MTKALKIDPSCSHVYYNRALCYIRRGNLPLALKDFDIVLCLASTVTNSNTQLSELETYFNRGLLHYEYKDFQNALQLVLKFGDEKKISALKHKLNSTIGQCYHRLTQFDKAIGQFTSSERIDRAMMDVNY